MSLFVDTSVLLPLVSANDPDHELAAQSFGRVGDELVTHNYVLVEAAALAQRRIGTAGARAVLEDLAPLCEIVWVDDELHATAVAAFLSAGRREVSIVDCVSFEVMRRRGIETAFAIDRDFRRQGFKTVP